MGHKVHPIGFRLGYIKGWESNWFSAKKNYATKLVEDNNIRKYIFARMPNSGIAKVVVERTIKKISLTIYTSKPGLIIGKGGGGVDSLKKELKKMYLEDIYVNIFEIKRPELNAKLVGESIAQQLRSRVAYKRVMKQAIASSMRAGAQGVKIRLSGRLGGAEIARSEEYREGRVPLHTLRADIDYGLVEAHTIYGKIGVKVWIFTGEVYGKRDLSPNVDLIAAKSKKVGFNS
jgi:small subunit ribosomal protein S3